MDSKSGSSSNSLTSHIFTIELLFEIFYIELHNYFSTPLGSHAFPLSSKSRSRSRSRSLGSIGYAASPHQSRSRSRSISVHSNASHKSTKLQKRRSRSPSLALANRSFDRQSRSNSQQSDKNNGRTSVASNWSKRDSTGHTRCRSRDSHKRRSNSCSMRCMSRSVRCRCGSRRSLSGSRRNRSGSARGRSGSRRSRSGFRRSRSGSSRSRSGSRRNWSGSTRSGSRSSRSGSARSRSGSRHSRIGFRRSRSGSRPSRRRSSHSGSQSSRSASARSRSGSRHSRSGSRRSWSGSRRSRSGSRRSRSGSRRGRSGSRHSGSARSLTGSWRSGSSRSRSVSRSSRSGSARSRSCSRRSRSGSSRSRSGSRRRPSGSGRCQGCYRRSRSDSRRSWSGSRRSGSARSQSSSRRSGSARSRSGSRRSRSGSVRSRSGSDRSGSVRGRSRSCRRSRSGSIRCDNESVVSRNMSRSRSASWSRSSGSRSRSGSPVLKKRRAAVLSESYADGVSVTAALSKLPANITETDNEGNEDDDVIGNIGIYGENSAKTPKPNDCDSSNEGDENQGNEFVPDFEAILSRKRDEKAERRKRRLINMNDNDEIIDQLIKNMRQAAQKDRDLNQKKEPATKKIAMLKLVMSQLIKKNLQQTFLKHNILTALAEWLAPLPNKSLPYLQIREQILKLLADFPTFEKSYLKQSGIGKAVMYLYKHPRETRRNRNRAGRLISDWARQIFNLSADIRTMSKEERLKRDMAMMPKKRKAISEPTATTKKSKKKDEVNIFAERERPLRPGEKGWVSRARVPLLSNKYYAVRPRSTSIIDMSRIMKKKPTRYENCLRKLIKQKRRRGGPQRAVQISIQGRKMAL